MQRDLTPRHDEGLKREMEVALIGTALRLARTARRYARHRLRHGYDYGCRRLLDEMRLARSLVLVLADEVRSERGPRTAA